MSYWQGKVAIVTGASQGLGLALAGRFAKAGARVVLVARGAERLEAAAQLLRDVGGDATPVTADVTVPERAQSLADEVRSRFGRIDVLINNAGSSARKAILETTPDDFRQLMELNLISVVALTRACWPSLIESRGHLVNIGSLASKVAARYMGAYPATKFALAAYTQQLRLELEPTGLHVLLVCPGPIARNEPRARSAEELAGLPASAAQPGAGAKVGRIRPEALADAIERACRRRRPELVVPGKARLLFAISQLSPAAGDWLLKRMT